jgi:Uma2 family endonuclease
MTVDEFLVWAETQPGRYELDDGEVVRLSAERTRHARTKSAAHNALAHAIRVSKLPCEALPDGMTVRIDDWTAFEPDAVVYCGPRIDGDAVEVPSPMIIVEVLSPGSRSLDLGSKLHRYWQVPSVEHVVLIDPKPRLVIHHARTGEASAAVRFLTEGVLRLDPPGLDVAVADLLGNEA